MKHLKTFEYINIDNIQKYNIIKQSFDPQFYIIEILSTNKLIVKYKYLYMLTSKLIKLKRENAESKIGSLNIIFSSDNLDDCKDYMYMMNSINKYNL